MHYNEAMEITEILTLMDKRGYTRQSLADELGISYDTLRLILSGKRPLTEQLERHIAHVLGKRESILVYRVDATAKKVEELTAGKGCKCEKDRVEALQAIIALNMKQLAELGARAGWTPEQLEAWGVEPEAKEPLHIEAGIIPGQLPRVAGRAE